MRKILILVEGATEEAVVRDVLSPYLEPRGLTFSAVILRTKREKSGRTFKGGVTSFGQIQRDTQALLKDTSALVVTTLIDYYGLPSEFPGLKGRPKGTALERVRHVETAFAQAIGHDRFVPHLTLHEIEAWVFASPTSCDWVWSKPETARQLFEMCDGCGGPENVNEGPKTSPSKRILSLAPGYVKTVDGPLAIESIGVDTIRATCPHMDSWLRRLESLAE